MRLEQLCFSTDRLSRRSFQRWLRHPGCVFLVAGDGEDGLSAYVLVILRRGTRLARLYSLAVDPVMTGRGLASQLLTRAEKDARDFGALYMRLEVASANTPAIALYRKAGYVPFGLYRDYYDDHDDALRMEKCIHAFDPESDSRMIPWLFQSTAFTCGPASLMMAMTALDDRYQPSPLEEIQIWREATTIFMTSGHGGCHPIGLALSAVKRGFAAEVWVNQQGALFMESVRDPNKKRVLRLVHDAFLEQAEERGVPIHYGQVDQQQLADSFNAGTNVLILISTYRLDNRKAPHWVVLSGVDEQCLYVHDPDLTPGSSEDVAEEARNPMECQHLPIARADFMAMSRFGGNRLQASVLVRRATATALPARPGGRLTTDE
jgi:ribosomal protein S18 acetylase RimI-like enzyme